MPQDAPPSTPETQQDPQEELRFAQAKLQKEQEHSKVLNARIVPIFSTMWGSVIAILVAGLATPLNTGAISKDCPSNCCSYINSCPHFDGDMLFVIVAVLLGPIAITFRWLTEAARAAKSSSKIDSRFNSRNALQDHIAWTKESFVWEKQSNVKKSAYLKGAMEIILLIIGVLLAIVMLYILCVVIEGTFWWIILTMFILITVAVFGRVYYQINKVEKKIKKIKKERNNAIVSKNRDKD